MLPGCTRLVKSRFSVISSHSRPPHRFTRTSSRFLDFSTHNAVISLSHASRLEKILAPPYCGAFSLGRTVRDHRWCGCAGGRTREGRTGKALFDVLSYVLSHLGVASHIRLPDDPDASADLQHLLRDRVQLYLLRPDQAGQGQARRGATPCSTASHCSSPWRSCGPPYRSFCASWRSRRRRVPTV